MLLSDPRLAFAQDLIRHWSRIRGTQLVPLKELIDPNEMRQVLPFIAIADVSRPNGPEVRLAGTGLRARYGQEITGSNWSRFVAPSLRPVMQAVIKAIVGTPCGLYYRFKVSADGGVMREAETVGLPLRISGVEVPTMTITLTHDISMRGIADPSSVETAKLEDLTGEFIDIGAGVPNGLATRTAPAADA